MKKMKKISAFLLALTMTLALAACGGNNGGAEANSSTATSGKQASSNPYHLDYQSADLQPMTSERASKEALLEAQEYYIHGLAAVSEEVTKQTYADMAAHIGVDASEFQYFERYGQYRYTWYLEGNEGASLMAAFNTDGSLYFVTSSIG